MDMKIEWRDYRPEGWTDDLGIIADRNQWVRPMPGGWHVSVKLKNDWFLIIDWLKDNNISYELYYENIVLTRDEDLVLYQLRWT